MDLNDADFEHSGDRPDDPQQNKPDAGSSRNDNTPEESAKNDFAESIGRIQCVPGRELKCDNATEDTIHAPDPASTYKTTEQLDSEEKNNERELIEATVKWIIGRVSLLLRSSLKPIETSKFADLQYAENHPLPAGGEDPEAKLIKEYASEAVKGLLGDKAKDHVRESFYKAFHHLP